MYFPYAVSTEACKSRRMRSTHAPTHRVETHASCYIQYRDEIGKIKASISLLRARTHHAHDAEHERGAGPVMRTAGAHSAGPPPTARQHAARHMHLSRSEPEVPSGPLNELRAALGTSAAAVAATLAARRATHRLCRAGSRPSTTCDARKGQGVTRERPSASTG